MNKNELIPYIIMTIIAIGILLTMMIIGAIVNTIKYGVSVFKK